VFDPVTHTAQFLDVSGEEASERQNLSVIFPRPGSRRQRCLAPRATAPGFGNRPTVACCRLWVANRALDDILTRRKPILTAKRLLTNQTFRDIYRTDTLAIGQRLKI
jgi:hypothetical protein